MSGRTNNSKKGKKTYNSTKPKNTNNGPIRSAAKNKKNKNLGK